MIYLDMVTKYYDKREPYNKRKYYNTPDELFIVKERFELVGKCIIPSWMSSKNIEITREI